MEKSFLKAFGELIRRKRNDKNLTIEKLAFISDISSDYLGKIELGRVNPSIYIVYKISKGLGLKLTDLTNGL